MFLPALNLKKFTVLALAVLSVLSLEIHANAIGTVDRIEITGNNKTRAITILQELPISPGDTLTETLLLDSEQAIKNLGLFKAVDVDTDHDANNELVVKVAVDEKRFNFVLPKVNRNGDGDVTTGIVWRSDNLFGLNQRSKLTLSYKTFDDTDENRETELSWQFSYPRITNTPYSFDLNFGFEETNLEETVDGESGSYERDRLFLEPLVGKWLRKEGPSQGLQIKGGMLWEDYDHELLSGVDNLFPDQTVKALVMSLEGEYVHDMLLSRRGHHFGYKLIYSDDITGSDINFVKHLAFYRKYIPLKGTDHANLNLRVRAGYITQSILGPPEFNIAGSRLLRGYERDSVEGNSFLLMNAEWLQPIFGRETLRAAVVVDAGNAWLSSRDASLSDLRYAVGFGLRWKLQRYVKTDIRLDIAHGLSDDGETKLYVGTNATF